MAKPSALRRAHDRWATPTAADIEVIVVAASIEELAASLTEWRMPADYFPCPSCQQQYRVDEAPQAQVLDGLQWSCSRCRRRSTIWRLRRTVLDNADAIDRLLDARRTG